MPETTLVRLEDKVDHMSAKLDKLCLLIEGDGGNDHPGLKVTVDRLSQSEKQRVWVVRSLFTGIFGLVAERLWGLLAR